MPDEIRQSDRLDPQVRAILEEGDRLKPARIETMTVDEARRSRTASFKANGGVPVALGRVEELQIPRSGGAIPARIYANDSQGLRTGLIYFHGGGFVIGDLETHDPLCRALAHESDAVIIAIHYRRAPENKFPAAVEDAYTATLWIAQHAAQLGIDPARLAIGGDSAGGTLATVTATRCRDSNGPALAAQVLLYPVLDVIGFNSASYLEFAENYQLTRKAMQWFGSHYLASPEDGLNPEASPILQRNLAGLPPALVVTAEFDPLRDEGEQYAARMQAAGGQVTATRYPGMIHGFAAMLGVLDAGKEVIREAGKFVRNLSA